MTTKMEHFDEDKLHNPEEMLYRFTYVAKFADFGEEDIKTVKASAALVGPLVPAIVDAVYEKLFSFDVTKSYFLPKVENYDGSVVASLDDLKLDSEQTKFRKDFLGKYLVKYVFPSTVFSHESLKKLTRYTAPLRNRLVTAEYDLTFIKYLDWVAKIHSAASGRKTGMVKPVEYVHVNALFAWLHGFLATAIDSHPDLQSKEAQPTRTKTLAAFSKLLWIQNDFFAKYYCARQQQ